MLRHVLFICAILGTAAAALILLHNAHEDSEPKATLVLEGGRELSSPPLSEPTNEAAPVRRVPVELPPNIVEGEPQAEEEPDRAFITGILFARNGDLMPKRAIEFVSEDERALIYSSEDAVFRAELKLGEWSAYLLGDAPSPDRASRLQLDTFELNQGGISRNLYVPGMWKVSGNFILDGVPGGTLLVRLLDRNGNVAAHARAANLDPLSREPEQERPPIDRRSARQLPGFVEFEGVIDGLYTLEVALAAEAHGVDLETDRREIEVFESLELPPIRFELEQFGVRIAPEARKMLADNKRR